MYNNLLSYIFNRIYDNGNGEITPTKVRQVFQQCLSELGSDANFMGIANPNTPPAASPDHKQMYVALPANFKRTFQGFGVGGGNYTLAAGRFAIFFYDSDQWNRAIMVVNGTTTSPIDSRQRVILEPVLTPITRRILADDSRVVTMTYDGADIDPTDSVDLDSSQHVVTFTMDDPTFSGVLPADTLDGAFGTWVLPEGIRTLSNNQTGVTAEAVVLPTTCTEIATGAIESLAVSSLTLTGAPPQIDPATDWSNINTLSIPNQYAILYQRADWQTAIAAVVAAGGTVVTDGGTAYDPTAVPFKTKQTAVVDPTASGIASSFIDSISQDANGVITVTKKNVKAEDTKVTQAQIDYTLADDIPLILKKNKNITTVTDTVSFSKVLTYKPKADELCAGHFVGDGSQLTGVPVSSHTHGNIQNDGTLQTNDVTIATGDKLVVTDSSDSAKVARASVSFDTSNTSDYLRRDGTWATPSGGGGSSMPAVDYHAYSANTQAITFASTHSYHTVSVSGSTQTFIISIPSANTFVNYLLVSNTGSSACTVALAAASGMTWTSFVLPTDAIEVAAGECVELSFISINSHTQLIVTKSAAMEETSLT